MATDPVSVVVVEDDPAQRAVLTSAFTARGMRVHGAGSGAQAMELLSVGQPDLVILDLGLPDVDGITLCRHVRLAVTCPIVVVTAQNDDGRVVDALDAGADDYIVKPFVMAVLMARVRVALRHGRALAAVASPDVVEVGDLRLDLAAHTADIAGEPVELTARQFALLVTLARNEGRIVTYDALSRVFDGDGNELDRNHWRTLVSKIRKALGSGPRRPAIHSELNVGYRLTVPDEPA